MSGEKYLSRISFISPVWNSNLIFWIDCVLLTRSIDHLFRSHR